MSKHVFISYQHDDGEFADNLIYQVEKNGFLTWIDSDGLVAGTPWRESIDQAIRDAFALIVIMSPAAKVSEYVTYEWAFAWGCGIKIIPIMYRKTELHPRLESLQYMDFTNRNHRPWNDLMWVLREAAAPYEPSPDSRATMPGPSPEKQARLWIEKGETFFKREDYDGALEAFKQAILIDPNNVRAYTGKSSALYELKRYREALVASNHALGLDPHYAPAWNAKGDALDGFERYEDSLEAFEQAIRLDPRYTLAWKNKGNAWYRLGRYEDALADYEQALILDPEFVYAWKEKGNALYNLGRYEGALSAYEQAIKLDPQYMWPWHNKGNILKKLGRTQEAEECFKKARELGYQEED